MSARGAHKALTVAVLSLLPLAAGAELVAGEVQHRRVPREADWWAAASAAVAARTPGDVIIVAPRWAAPEGRLALGRVPAADPPPDPPDVRVAARSDLDVYTRALELSIRGKDDPQTAGWSLEEERKFGPVSLRVFRNPHPDRLVRDLSDEIDATAKVTRVWPPGSPNGVEACRWEEGGGQHMPNLFAGPEPPTSRWLCSPFDPGWTFVGASVFTDLSYTPRRCIAMHPTYESTTTIELPARPIGRKVVAYVGLHVFVERELSHAPVFARISVAGKEVAKARHRDGDGWLRFEGSTAEFAGTAQPVKIETWAEAGNAVLRFMCVAAQLRD